MRQFVRIANRDRKYTNPKRAQHYVRRGLAREFLVSLSGQLLEIWMLEAAEIAVVQSQIRRDKAANEPKFGWFVSESGGSQLMREYTGIGGGTRLWNADSREPQLTAPAPA